MHLKSSSSLKVTWIEYVRYSRCAGCTQGKTLREWNTFMELICDCQQATGSHSQGGGGSSPADPLCWASALPSGKKSELKKNIVWFAFTKSGGDDWDRSYTVQKNKIQEKKNPEYFLKNPSLLLWIPHLIAHLNLQREAIAKHLWRETSNLNECKHCYLLKLRYAQNPLRNLYVNIVVIILKKKKQNTVRKTKFIVTLIALAWQSVRQFLPFIWNRSTV